MNWRNKKEIRSELFLILGMVLIIIGFIDLIELSGKHVLVAGLLIMGIGIGGILKHIKRGMRR